MLYVYTEDHKFQDGSAELIDGQIHPPVEKPERAELIRTAVRDAGLGEETAPEPVDRAVLEKVHAPAYLEFLETAWDAWQKAHGDWDALPICWPTRTFSHREPEAIDGLLSYYSFDAGSPITPGTWRAATASAGVAATGAAFIAGGEQAVFSLCRPPGHHAARDVYGGYCFLNNAAVAIESLRERGCERIALLDVDYHHGNGSQAIFYHRPDVFFISIHADPRQDFPFFLGFADEIGDGKGEGANINMPLRWGTGWSDGYEEALAHAVKRAAEFGPDALVVSLGVDTFDGDPISRFKLQTTDYPRLGGMIAEIRVPTLFVMEGGYAVSALGDNVAGVLKGFEDA